LRLVQGRSLGAQRLQEHALDGRLLLHLLAGLLESGELLLGVPPV
jgi:hypothetical protein